MEEKALLEVRGLSLQLGEFAFRDLDFQVETGEYCIILGPTGAGKTVLLETIAGIHRPAAGKIFFDGEDITNLPPEDRGVGIVYQDYMLFPHLRVIDNIAFGLKQAGVEKSVRQKAAREAAERFGIGHLLMRYPSTLSGGEQQRASIARALLLKPKVLLLDEPLSALDSVTRDRLRSELQRIHRETGTTFLHITHHFEDMYALAERVVVMQDAKIVQQGSPEGVLSHPSCDFVAGFMGMENLYSGYAQNVGEGISEISIGHAKIFAASEAAGAVRVGIRPEDVLVSRDKLVSSARNSLYGTVTGVWYHGIYSLITADCSGISVTAAVTRQSLDMLGAGEGEKVWMTFKASAVCVF